MEFLTSSQLELNPAGYLVSTVSTKPVLHAEFVAQQKAAEYTVKLAEAIKDKSFTATKVDSIETIKQQVLASINKASVKSYVSAPAKPTNDINDQLVKFALDYVGYESDKLESSKINDFMQQFNKINDIEEVGEYFSEGLVKLSKIYTIVEILAAVTICVNKLK